MDNNGGDGVNGNIKYNGDDGNNGCSKGNEDSTAMIVAATAAVRMMAVETAEARAAAAATATVRTKGMATMAVAGVAAMSTIQWQQWWLTADSAATMAAVRLVATVAMVAAEAKGLAEVKGMAAVMAMAVDGLMSVFETSIVVIISDKKIKLFCTNLWLSYDKAKCGVVNAVLPVIMRYFAGSMINPAWPWLPPPSVVGMVADIVMSSFSSNITSWSVGLP